MASSSSVNRPRTRRAPKRAAASPSQTTDPVIRLEIYGIIVFAFALAFLLSLISFDPRDVAAARSGQVANWLGPVGANIANLFLGGFGLGSFFLSIAFGWLGLSYIFGRRARMGRVDLVGAGLAILAFVTLAHTFGHPARVLGHPPGGLFGSWTGEISASLFSTPGTVLLFVAIGIVSVILLTRRSIFELLQKVLGGGGRLARWLLATLKHGDTAAEDEEGWEEAAEPAIHTQRSAVEPASRRLGQPPPAAPEREAALPPAPEVRISEPASRKGRGASTKGKKLMGEQGELPLSDAPSAEAEEEEDGIRIVESAAMKKAPVFETPETVAPRARAPEGQTDDEPEPDRDADVDEGGFDAEDDGPEGIRLETGPYDAQDRDEGDEGNEDDDDDEDDDGPMVHVPRPVAPDDKPFELPSLAMLDYRPPETTSYDRELLKRNAQILEAKLLDYKVKGRVTEIHPGPVITMYEFLPAPGIKISAIANLSDDLAMALSALRIRIVAPIPGKNVVGIEVPNAARETVWLKEILSDESYTRAKSRMTLALGKDITGHPTSMDLAKAPHLLVAGSTGSGKSVAINSFVVSLLYKAEPSDVRLIMVDPKMLELSIYEGIPHLLLPVVTDPKQAATALKWAVKEMTRRYQLMADMGVRNLAGYNARVQQLLDDPSASLPERLRLAKLKREAKGQADPAGEILGCDGKPIERLPCIVVIIDELADLMMVASKEVETCIARLAQMARASGIHLILATQRPSVDVLTGLIKANFPTRISFQVASKTDSRTILDRNGAEALLGMGDMLFMPPGSGGVKRVHGCYVSEEEVHTIVAHLKAQGSPEYDMGILASDDEEGGGGDLAGGGDASDELYDQAVRIAAEAQQVSTSFLQRKLKIGYNRAARIIEQMEEQGIIGPSDGTSRPREVFIDPL